MDKLNDINTQAYRFTINTHPDFIKDIHDIIDHSGHNAEFMKVFRMRLKQLGEYGGKAVIYFPDNFEVLKHETGMCSMRIKTKNLNVRILYSFIDDSSIILLHGFFKRSKKKVSDYTNHTPIAKQRLAEKSGGNRDE